MKAKVCILTTVHPPFDTRIFHKQAKTLARAGYDVTLIAQHDGDRVVEGVRIIGLPKPRNRFTRIFGLTWRAFRLALRQHADVYHFHDPELLLPGALLKLFTRAKVIYDVHEDYPSYIRMKGWLPSVLRAPLSAFVETLELLGTRIFDAIVTADDEVANRFKKAKMLAIIHNFPDLELFMGCERHSSAKIYDIIYLGSISPYHINFMLSVALLLEKMGHVFRWCIVGVSERQHTLARKLLQELGIKHRFCLCGRIPHSCVVKYLAYSKVGVIPLPHKEKFMKNIPTKLFEYMACRIPVVASDLPPIRKFVGTRGCAILVPPEDEEAFASAIDFLLSNPQRAQAMGEKGRSLVEQKFNWARESKKLLTLYRRLINA